MRYYFGHGLLNTAINKLPFELHIPSYSYCGPGTRLNERLNRGDKPKNLLDQSCLKHDLFYNQENDTKERHKADTILANEAMQRFHSKDASFGEKLAALGVAGVMKAKVKLGMGLSKKPNFQQMTKKSIHILQKTKIATENILKNINESIRLLQGDIDVLKTVKPKKQPSGSKPNRKNQQLQQQRKQYQQKKNNSNKFIPDEPINLNMEIDINRKRRINDTFINNETNNEVIPHKKQKFSSLPSSRKVQVGKRKLQVAEPYNSNTSILNEPLNVEPSESRKRKLNLNLNDNLNLSDSEEDTLKKTKLEYNI